MAQFLSMDFLRVQDRKDQSVHTDSHLLRLLPELRQKLGWQAQCCLLAGGHRAASSLFGQSALVFRSGALFFVVLIRVAPFFLRVL